MLTTTTTVPKIGGTGRIEVSAAMKLIQFYVSEL
jgi:hypothetical protein